MTDNKDELFQDVHQQWLMLDGTPMERLRKACSWHAQKRISSYTFLSLIKDSFRDDNGMDWLDSKELKDFASLILHPRQEGRRS